MRLLESLLVWILRAVFTSRRSLALENLALRQQLAAYTRTQKRPRLKPGDRAFWVALSKVWRDWRSPLVLVKPATVIAWYRRGHQRYWSWKCGKPGRPRVPAEHIAFIRRISTDHPEWGEDRIADNPVVKPGNNLQGRGSLLLGGTFTCMFGPQVDRYQNLTWTCQGDNRFHQFAGFEASVSPHHLALGTWHTCENTNSGMPNCWGRGDGGQLGFTPGETCHVDGKAVACSRAGHKVPFQVPAGSGPVLAGDMFTCVVSRKEVSCWGASRDGWIGTASA